MSRRFFSRFSRWFATVLLALCAVATLAITGCIDAGAGTELDGGDGAGDGTGDSGDRPSATSTISFSVPASASSSRVISGSSAAYGPHVFWIENYHRFSSEVQLAPLLNGTNSIEVGKDRNVIAGIADIPDPAAVSALDLGSAISLIGTIQITSAGLDAVPVGETAEDEIDLGSVSVDESEQAIESTATTSEVADAVGYSEDAVATFGRFDQMFAKFANLDIDRSGVPDGEENLRWNLITQTVFPMEGTIYDVETGAFLVNPSGFAAGTFEYMYIARDIDEYTANGTVTYPQLCTLALPENGAGIASLSQSGSYTVSWGGNESPFDDGGTAFYIRFPTTDPALIAVAPIPGDYEVGISHDATGEGEITEEFRFYLNGMEFISPGDNYDGLIIPVIDYDLDDDGFVQNISWTWKKIANGTYEDAGPEEVRLQVMSFLLAFDAYSTGAGTLNLFQRRQEPDGVWYVMNGNEGNDVWYPYKLGIGIYDNADTEENRTTLGVSYYESVSLDVSAYPLPFNPDADSLVVLTEDSAGNFYGYLYSRNAALQ